MICMQNESSLMALNMIDIKYYRKPKRLDFIPVIMNFYNKCGRTTSY